MLPGCSGHHGNLGLLDLLEVAASGIKNCTKLRESVDGAVTYQQRSLKRIVIQEKHLKR
jgi:hypothetical protein